ncbi:hypothetical protein LL037_12965 [Clostridium estertheticum]|uniref:Uncharacterized protein n=1 Tax=Clostridium estertheticum TaxID=238834 RepID=A0AA47ELM4_9CLOT|nr:hypothetical protein [Clostridium estertheticum]MBU3157883.1 hypothetical protein [Clostridium estertheticum]MBU3200983.1 hypothetical protein [Clostridium estertheticum]WAG62503.1 hypothetical protein LL038_09800 [Clostridium estertheticum]WAG63405.1 hypothetical protein LL037_12965 [Clostridium estertheticum]
MKMNDNGPQDFTLNIIINNDRSIQGEIQHCQSNQTSYFRSLIEMIILINGKLNEVQLSQPSNEFRSWVKEVIPL